MQSLFKIQKSTYVSILSTEILKTHDLQKYMMKSKTFHDKNTQQTRNRRKHP